MSPALDHDAIRKAYPNAVRVSDSKNGAWDASGNKITLVQSQIDAARVELDKLRYREDRAYTYPSIGDSLDNLYKDILAGKVDSSGEFAKAIKAIKDKYPKS